jgi:NH3-dependent NAD+ synthetase
MDKTELTNQSFFLYQNYLEELRIAVKSISDFYPILTAKEARNVYRYLVNAAVNHLERSGLKSVIVPASGGADSTFMLKILHDATEICRKNGKDIKVVGITLPCKLQSDAEYYDDMGSWACDLYADDYFTINLRQTHEHLMKSLFTDAVVKMRKSGKDLTDFCEEVNPNYSEREYRVDRGNLAARLRMIVAYGYAKRLGGAPASTDNESEHQTGFWTLCGDEGTFKYIQHIWKGLEQPLLMNAAGIPTPFYMQKPTDGLGVGDGDVSQMYGSLYTGKETYINVDICLIRFLRGHLYPDPLYPNVIAYEHPVCLLNVKTDFKRHPYCISRSLIGLPEIEP